MPDALTLVVDASVEAKWHLQDEDLVDEALALRGDYGDGRISIAMPDYARYEVASIFSMAWQRGRVSAAAAHSAVADFEALGFEFFSDRDLILHAMRLVEDLGCAFYDALYLALAEEMRTFLITADARLVRRVQGKTSHLMWLGDYHR